MRVAAAARDTARRRRAIDRRFPDGIASAAFDGLLRVELYDYQNDPGETRNLAADEPSMVAKLRVLLAAQGVDVLVTHHHLPGDRLPSPALIVNPNQPGCAFPSKHVAGVGVMFYVLAATRSLLRPRGRDEA